ncbi:MAG TPA: ABC transporter ATP-binding protein [Actinomycetota bacterium]|nr:ABC transporter ATP-binding protein [Actinomycetota bacterium]
MNPDHPTPTPPGEPVPAETAGPAPAEVDLSRYAILAQQLTKKYGTFTAVDRLDLEVDRGEIFGLLGPNGAGKTTTILMLLGLTEPTRGAARVVGLDPRRDPLEIKRRVGYLPDNVGFYADMSGYDNLRYTARLNGIRDDDAHRAALQALDQVGLSGPGHDKVSTYSRGMRQRLGIADALVKDPEILILDEPTISLDPEAVEETLELVRRLPRERGVAVLLSSHMLHQVQAICDRVAIFVRGRVVAQGRVSELAEKLTDIGVTIEVGADGAEIGEALRAVPDVVDVRREGELWVVRATTDVRAPMIRALMDRGVTPTHVRRRGAELDDIYRRYFRTEEARDEGS